MGPSSNGVDRLRLRCCSAALLFAACGTRQEPSRLKLSGSRLTIPADSRPSALNAECERCHADIAAEWRGSLHHQSFSNDSFQVAFARERLAFCQGCHAPEADPEESAPVALGRLGVACTTCHSAEARGLARMSAGTTTSNAQGAPHAMRGANAPSSDEACGSCHEFAFPDAAQRGHTELMQSTLSEHRLSATAGTSCVDCHMQRVAPGARRSHGFAASRDAFFLRGAISVTAQRIAPDRVRIELVPTRLGHAFPTGDLFRRLVVSAEAVGPDYQLLGSEERFLTRHFSRVRQGASLDLLELRDDDRVGLRGPAASSVELEPGPQSVNAPIAWRVAYQRVAHPQRVDERDALVEAEIEIASGMLAAQPVPALPSRRP